MLCLCWDKTGTAARILILYCNTGSEEYIQEKRLQVYTTSQINILDLIVYILHITAGLSDFGGTHESCVVCWCILYIVLGAMLLMENSRQASPFSLF